ncbi:MAG TPA: hypothetical protein VFK85_16895 [Anaeromyxobacteraceae bacterium]|nr:hypothetical protein [Anaeromyxobacteraceae bacterium]
MGNPNDRTGRTTEPENEDTSREAGAEKRIEQRREHDKEISRREEEGYSQPESSAQKMPDRGQEP